MQHQNQNQNQDQSQLKLIGAYTRYSSWTARVAVLLDYYRIPHESVLLSLPESTKLSKSGLVPALEVPSLGPQFQINDSLAICEYLAEVYPDLPLWPKDAALRAQARAAVAQMHSGLCSVLRASYPTNALARYTGAIPLYDGAAREVENCLKLWGESRRFTRARLAELGQEGSDEGFLFGQFGIADAFFWPVLWRFRSYNLPLTGATPEALEWMKRMWSHPKIKEIVHGYYLQKERPETTISHYDDIFKGNPDVQFGWFPEDWEFSA
ncbi:Glutamine amidotransferase subunit pdxT [Trichophyton interdigitale]|nr:Glutamine amidotransferase subunit pdxT [Trichophyton interdigitale]KAG5218640.1 Glutamine amidotransferase subunit pdxT [Trichophyton interdigitale]KAG8206399.1 Glutamine amidotransferase subunit pdxT [Trichophyton interdigitale]